MIHTESTMCQYQHDIIIFSMLIIDLFFELFILKFIDPIITCVV